MKLYPCGGFGGHAKLSRIYYADPFDTYCKNCKKTYDKKLTNNICPQCNKTMKPRKNMWQLECLICKQARQV